MSVETKLSLAAAAPRLDRCRSVAAKTNYQKNEKHYRPL